MYAAWARALADEGEVLARLADVGSGRHHPTLLFAAVHDLVLAGLEHEVARYYRLPDVTEASSRAFLDVWRDHGPELRATIATRTTQTNEPNRSSVLRPALNAAAAGEEIGLVDVGASAGLNLLLDRYAYRYDPGGVVGVETSPVHLTCSVTGPAPVGPDPVIGGRVGIDRSPVDIADDRERRWLRACLWPGQVDRDARLTAALALCRRDRPPVEQGDGVEGVGRAIARLPEQARAVVVTTWALAYFSKQARTAFAAELAAASRHRPVDWVSVEAPGVVAAVPPVTGADDGASAIGLVRFRAGGLADASALGTCHPHGNWLRWPA